MTAEEKSVLSLFMIGVLIVVGKVLAGGEPITPRLFIGRMLLGGFVSMVAGVVLVQFPDLSLPAVCGIGSMLGIRKYWEPVSAFFGGVVEGLKAAFAPVGELFMPLKPVFDWLGEKLQAAWQWFKNLIAPVKATQDTLNRCRDTGVMFGQALADALMLPLNAFNKLRSGIDWVLEKLGVINKESDTLDQTAARTHAATYGTGGYIPATSSYAGYQAYQPVTALAGRSYVDQSKNEYHISLTGGTAPGTQLDRQLQDALEKYERDKRARARASMMHDG
ncbi:phage holin family protein [Escherichia coli]|nr:phage holin family protein [Escherichia coli]